MEMPKPLIGAISAGALAIAAAIGFQGDGGPCKNGWAYHSIEGEDHVVVDTCNKDGVTVWLNELGEFDHSWDGVGDFNYDVNEAGYE